MELFKLNFNKIKALGFVCKESKPKAEPEAGHLSQCCPRGAKSQAQTVLLYYLIPRETALHILPKVISLKF